MEVSFRLYWLARSFIKLMPAVGSIFGLSCEHEYEIRFSLTKNGKQSLVKKNYFEILTSQKFGDDLPKNSKSVGLSKVLIQALQAKKINDRNTKYFFSIYLFYSLSFFSI